MPQRLQKTSICLFHEANLGGGGQTFVNSLYSGLTQTHYPAKLITGSTALTKWQQTQSGKQSILIANVYTTAQFWQLVFWKLRGNPVWMVAHGVWYREWQSRLGRKNWRGLQTWQLFLAQWILFGLADRIITLSQYSARLVQESFPLGQFWQTKLSIIPGIVPKSPAASKSVSRIQGRRLLGLSSRTTTLLAVGRLERRKGFELLCRAFNQVVKKQPQTVLILVLDLGPSSQPELLADLATVIQATPAQDKIKIILNPSQSYLYRLYQAADIFVLSSTELETFGFVTVEALQAGLPVIGFTAGATPEVLGPTLAKNLLVKNLTVAALAQKLTQYGRSSRSFKQKLVTACRQRAKVFASNKVVPQWLELLRA